MGLYRNTDRILADLAADGFGAGQPLTVADLTPYDQYHYEGTSAVDKACHMLGVRPGSRVLDIGSGLGGPARYIANRTGAMVTALEIQADLHATSEELTARCGLGDLVEHVNGDMLLGAAGKGRFSGIVSMLCFLHIPDRQTLFDQCAAALQPGGAMFVDDYYQKQPLTETEQAELAQKVYCPYLPDRETYAADVEGAGFVGLEIIDKTADWASFVVDRLAKFKLATPGRIDRYGADTVRSLDDFYSSVAQLFTNGGLGGLRLVARLPDE